MLAPKKAIHIGTRFVQSYGLKWSGQNFFVFDLEADHPLLAEVVELEAEFYVFCHLTHGSAAVVHDQQCIILGRNSIFTFLPGRRYQFGPSPDTRIRGMLVAKDFLERINFGVELCDAMPYLLRNVPLYVTEAEADVMAQMLAQLLYNNRHSRHSSYHPRLQKTGFLMYAYELGALYQKYAACLQRPPLRRCQALYNSFLALLATHFRQERTVEFYARQLTVTPNYFSEAIKDAQGKTAGQLIAETVVSEARKLLEETAMSVQEIADALSFPDQATFAKYFKKHVGLSPKHYRGTALEKNDGVF